MKNLFDLTSKTALITGGGGLLGKKHAEAIIEFGGKAIIADYSSKRANSISKQLNDKYKIESCFAEYIDVTNTESIQDVINKYSSIDILINNAAKNPKVVKNNKDEWFSLIENNRFETMPKEYWNEGLDVILNGNFLVTQLVVNKMIDTDSKKCDIGGVILNIASDLGVIAPDQRIYKKDPNQSFDDQDVKPIFYSAAKWAVIGITKYLSTYLAEKNIRVNSLSPGGVYNDHPPEFVNNISELIPLNRMANIDEYKGAIVYLCSEASSYMTGHNLIVDGGRSVW